MAKYYAVVVGRVPGIYNSWEIAKSMIYKFPGAVFKSFHSYAEAETFLNMSTASKSTAHSHIPHMLPLADKTIIYTDGSYKLGASSTDSSAGSRSAGGFGIVILTTSGEKITAYGKVPLESTNNVAELYAIYVALSLVKGNVILYTDSNYSIGCLTTYIHDWIKTGWAGVVNRELIEATYNLIGNRQITFTHIAAHSGFTLNEEADQLANQGRLTDQELIIHRLSAYRG